MKKTAKKKVVPKKEENKIIAFCRKCSKNNSVIVAMLLLAFSLGASSIFSGVANDTKTSITEPLEYIESTETCDAETEDCEAVPEAVEIEGVEDELVEEVVVEEEFELGSTTEHEEKMVVIEEPVENETKVEDLFPSTTKLPSTGNDYLSFLF